MLSLSKCHDPANAEVQVLFGPQYNYMGTDVVMYATTTNSDFLTERCVISRSTCTAANSTTLAIVRAQICQIKGIRGTVDTKAVGSFNMQLLTPALTPRLALASRFARGNQERIQRPQWIANSVGDQRGSEC